MGAVGIKVVRPAFDETVGSQELTRAASILIRIAAVNLR